MGCDIHFHTEVKIDGKWEHYSNPTVHRFYKFFALLCNVRNKEGKIKPFLEEANIGNSGKIPEDITLVTKKALFFFKYEEDYHSLCIFDSKMIFDFYKHLIKLYRNEEECLLPIDIEHKIIGYLCGESWDIVSETGKELKPRWVEDVRWMFAFDN